MLSKNSHRWPGLAAPWLLALSMGLAGCATAPQRQDAGTLASTHGYVHALTPKGLGTSIEVESVGDGKTYVLPQRCDDCRSYGLWLPEGDYVLSKWDQAQWPTGIPPFTVKRQHATSLGALVPLELGSHDFVVMPVQNSEVRDQTTSDLADQRAWLPADKAVIEWLPNTMPPVLKTALPVTSMGVLGHLLLEYERHVNKPPALARIRSAKTVDELMAGAKTITPPTTLEHARLPDGSLLYGAEMGQIRLRTPNKEWRNVDTGTLHAVTALMTEGSDILTGSSDGVIRRGTEAGPWVTLKRLPRPEKIVALFKAANGQRIVVSATEGTVRGIRTMLSTKAVTVYTARRDDFSDLAELKRFDQVPTPNFWTAHAEITSQAMYLNVLPDLWRYRFDTRTWDKVNPPADVTRFSLSDDGRTLVAYKVQGAFSKLYLSKDGGSSWTQKDTPPYTIVDIFFQDESRAAATRWSAGALSGNYEFMRYDAAGDRWVKTEDVPEACKRIVWTADPGEKLCVTNGHSILSKAAEKWQVEFAVE